MKKFLVASLFILLSFSISAGEIIKASKDDGLSVLDLVVGIHQTYSGASQLEGKVVELLGGDGMNPTRMVLILGTGDPTQENRIFDLGVMMLQVNRITFSAKDTIIINYTQDDIDREGKNIVVKRSIKIEVLRNAKGELSGEIKIN